MAHTDPINPDILADVARQIGFFAGIRPDVFANQRLSLGASFAIWTLTPTITHDPATGKPIRGADPANTNGWHHQIVTETGAIAFARSVASDPNDPTLTVRGVYPSSLASKIARAFRPLPRDPLVRLLAIPPYQLHALWIMGPNNNDVLIVDAPRQYKTLPAGTRMTFPAFVTQILQESPIIGISKQKIPGLDPFKRIIDQEPIRSTTYSEAESVDKKDGDK